MSFSASEAAFEGFRIARAHPVAIAVWAVISLAFSLLMAVVLISLAGPQLAEFVVLSQGGATATPEQSLELMSAIGPAYAAVILVGLLYYAVMLPAVERAVLRPGTGGKTGFLALGGVELRHLLLILAIMLITIVIYVAALIILTFLAAALSQVAGNITGVLVGVAGGLAALVLILWLTARFVLAGPIALIEGGLGLRRSWKLSKGRTWALLGGLIIAVILAVVVGLLIITIFAGLAVAIGGLAAVGAVFQPDMSSLQAYFSPLTLGYMAISAVSSALTFAIIIGYGASAYQQLKGEVG